MSAGAPTGTSCQGRGGESEWRGEKDVNTELLQLSCNNPILMSRLPHHHNHKALQDYGEVMGEAGCDVLAAPLRLSDETDKSLCLAHKRLAL